MYRDELIRVPCDAIEVSPFQPRKEFCQEEIESLASSIRAIGLIHPPRVRRVEDGRYELISGERRLRASKFAGLTEIPVLVGDGSDERSAHAALIENVQRVDLNPIEVARSLADLAHRFGLTQEQLAERVGKRRSTIANYLRLLSLPPDIQKSVEKGEISMGHAKAILSQGSLEGRLHLYRRIVRGSLSVREAEEAAIASRKRPKSVSSEGLFLRDLEGRLQRLLGMRVSLKGRGKGGGTVAIEYSDLDALDTLLERLGVDHG